jgi:hypothetical protein
MRWGREHLVFYETCLQGEVKYLMTCDQNKKTPKGDFLLDLRNLLSEPALLSICCPLLDKLSLS